MFLQRILVIASNDGLLQKIMEEYVKVVLGLVVAPVICGKLIINRYDKEKIISIPVIR